VCCKHNRCLHQNKSKIHTKGVNADRKRFHVQVDSHFPVQQMYGWNGAMKQGASMTTLTSAGAATATAVQENWRHPAGPLGFRLSTPARARLYCQAK
jgi:hypothetical protein